MERLIVILIILFVWIFWNLSAIKKHHKTKVKLDSYQKSVFEYITKNNGNVFIQGKAGTGKSTFIKFLAKYYNNNILIAAPTGIAAINIDGSTINSLYKIPPEDILDQEQIIDSVNLDPNKYPRKKLFEAAELLIIDEISMVRPDILDAIDNILRELLDKEKPFGGKQLLLLGDLFQLPPIIKNDKSDTDSVSVSAIFKDIYGFSNAYFFDSIAYKTGKFRIFEFTKVYRQDADNLLTKNLDNLRNNINIQETINYFNTLKHYDPKMLNEYTTITPYRKVAENINNKRLRENPNEPLSFTAKIIDKFPADEAPSPKLLTLKVGTLVMFTNNSKPNWHNGSMGVITGFEKDENDGEDIIIVSTLPNKKEVRVIKTEWEKKQYYYDKKSGKVSQKTIGKFIQFPLALGYAMTIHKAQGKTLHKVIIDISRGAFAHGQTYVALSRTRYSSDMYIKNDLKISDCLTDHRIINFLSKK
ncbi:MAG: AAA family ATPase [Rickettsiales bacterium]|jgi:ATP-dependent exoDNAse (exonuclease V) alpha subunit|nr:AAA family ATPase [Rickettsiales bacterium]